ncbi:MAG: phosphoenolpyruvate synthase, partial [Phycisphaeraceae bacterium]
MSEDLLWFDTLGSDDVPRVGGKNASLGEMVAKLKSRGIRVPDGFATTAEAYQRFVHHNELEPLIREELARFEKDAKTLREVGRTIRKAILEAQLPASLADHIRQAYRELSQRYGVDEIDIAARSSATAEDLPQASFAGQLESYLNVRGEQAVLDACRRCFASLFTDRAISYRQEKGFDHLKVYLSVGVQKMVRSDQAGAGVAFTIDTETGFPGVVIINAGWGLGEAVVAGRITPDEYRVFKPLLDEPGVEPIIEKQHGSQRIKIVYAEDDPEHTTREVDLDPAQRDQFVLNDAQVLQLARWCRDIEQHYGRPMDIEWARDGEGDVYIVQARPETVEARRTGAALTTYRLNERGKTLVEGLSIGNAIGQGKVFVLKNMDESDRFEDGGILVTGMTNPDWGPVLERAAGVITDHGGRTSHAAIVARELGVPAVVGTGDATKKLPDGEPVTIDCTQGDQGIVYEGTLPFEKQERHPEELPKTRTKIMMILARPDAASRWWRLPVEGVGLARMEFIISDLIQIHPLALTRFDEVTDEQTRKKIEKLTAGYESRERYFVERLGLGMARIAAVSYPYDVIVRLSDFKTNEYAQLIGGSGFEPEESNPMLGFRGASRYYSEHYRDGFALECQALSEARLLRGMRNIVAMVPFCRTPEEADRVLATMAEFGLVRGEHGLRIYVMAEIPSNIIEAEAFAERFDGFSIGSNDLTQLVLGVSRDAERIRHLFDERETSVKRMIRELIERAHAAGKPVGLCGQAPSDHPEFAEFLVEAG